MNSLKKLAIGFIALTTILLVRGENLFAQAFKGEFAIEGGAGIRTVKFDPAITNLDNKIGVGFTGGLSGAYNFSDMWGLKLGAYYERKGADLKRTDVSATGKYNLDYISIPLMVKAKFGKGKTRFFANVGPYVGILLSSKTKMDAYGGNPEMEIDNDSTTKKTDFGISGGIGVEFLVGKSGAFTIEARDNFGLTDINDSKESGVSKIKLNTANFMVGYVFKLGKTATKKR